MTRDDGEPMEPLDAPNYVSDEARALAARDFVRVARGIPRALVTQAEARSAAWLAAQPPLPTHCLRCGLTLVDGAGAGRVCEPSPVGATVYYCEVD